MALKLRRWFLTRRAREFTPALTCRRCTEELVPCRCGGAFRERHCRDATCGQGFTCPTHHRRWF